MNKLSKLIKGISLLLRHPYLINKVLDDSEVHRRAVLGISDDYQEGIPTIDFLSVFPDFEEKIQPYSYLDGGSLVTDLALLKGLCKQFAACNYFEIGTWRGESAANVAGTVEQCYTLNLPDDALRALGLQEAYIGQQSYFSKSLPNVTHLKGNSYTFDFSPYYGQCDVVFVDGDHHFEAVKNDTAIAFQLLRNENSVIVWHDYAHNPEKVRWDVFRGILEGTPPEKRAQLRHVSNTLCAMYSTKTFPTLDKSRLIIPTKYFEVEIKARV